MESRSLPLQSVIRFRLRPSTKWSDGSLATRTDHLLRAPADALIGVGRGCVVSSARRIADRQDSDSTGLTGRDKQRTIAAAGQSLIRSSLSERNRHDKMKSTAAITRAAPVSIPKTAKTGTSRRGKEGRRLTHRSGWGTGSFTKVGSTIC